MKTIASRYWDKNNPVWYVSEKAGHGGVDWGYTSDVTKAIHLSKYWQRRFNADCNRCNVSANFIKVLRNEVGNIVRVKI